MSEGNVMSGSRSATLRKVLRSAAALDQLAATDRELLRRFARENDQSAFEALVNRHTAMVFGVCRRALPHMHDAEDACQATFLILAGRAKDGRWQESVANWLYTTARKVARNARVAAERRVRRETGAAVPEAVEPVDRMTARELLSALDAALDRLPAGYREPVVLCYLEGLTRDEAASRLGVPLATLHTRIDRARKRLHAILTRAGCTLGIGLLARAVTSPAEASPPQLVPSILANAAGNVPAAVLELAKGVAVNGSFRKVAFALAAVVVVALGSGLGLLSSSTAGQPLAGPAPERAEETPPEPPPPKDAAAKPVQKETTLTGRVLDPDGKPLAGAKLFAGRPNKLVEVGTSGADGKFTVTVPADLVTPYGYAIATRAEGVGLEFRVLPPNRGEEIELRTVKDHPVRGRILDTQGKPVAGATVAVSTLAISSDNSLDGFLAQKMRGSEGGMSRSLSHETGVLSSTTTDKDGRFTIEGAGAERLITLRVSGAGLAETNLLIVNRKDFDPKPYNELKPVTAVPGLGMRAPDAPVGFHGPDESLVVEPEKLIRGTVTDIDTGKPRVGAKVTMGGVTTSRDGLMFRRPLFTAVTNAEGKYELHGVRRSASYGVQIESDPATRYIEASARVNDTAGYEPVVADFKVKKGVVVTGRIIDMVTKEPVRGNAFVAILRDNKFVKEYPGFGTNLPAMVSAGEDGVFRIVTVPGPVLLIGNPAIDRDTAKRYKPAEPDPKYPQYFDAKLSPTGLPLYVGYSGRTQGIGQCYFCKVLEIKADAETVEQDVLLEPAPKEPKKPVPKEPKKEAEKTEPEKEPAKTDPESITLKGHTGEVSSVSFSPDGKRIVTGGGVFQRGAPPVPGEVKVWDAEKGTEILALKGHTNRVSSVCFSPDGKHIASASLDQTVRVWDAEKGQELFTLKGHTAGVIGVCFSPDGKRIASADTDRTVRTWDAEKGQELMTLRGKIGFDVFFSPDGKRIASVGTDPTVRTWDAEKGEELPALTLHVTGVTNFVHFCFSPDGKRLAGADFSKTVRVWDAEKGQELMILRGHTGPVIDVCYSPDGKRLASSSLDKTVRVWNADKVREPVILKGHTADVRRVCFSPDGKRLASASNDKTVRVWSLDKDK